MARLLFRVTTIHLDAAEAVKLFHAAGRIPGTDVFSEHAEEIYDSLSFVVYRMMDRD